MKDSDIEYLSGVVAGAIIMAFLHEHRWRISGWLRSRYDRFVQDIAEAIKEGK